MKVYDPLESCKTGCVYSLRSEIGTKEGQGSGLRGRGTQIGRGKEASTTENKNDHDSRSENLVKN